MWDIHVQWLCTVCDSHPKETLMDAAVSSLNPYSSPGQINVVINYHGIPLALDRDWSFLPSLDLTVSAFLKYQLHKLCSHIGDPTASVAWASAMDRDQCQLDPKSL